MVGFSSNFTIPAWKRWQITWRCSQNFSRAEKMIEINPYRIRDATLADNVLLAEIGAQTFADTFAADNTPEDMRAYLEASFNPEKQASELADPNSRFLIVEQDGETVGYTRLNFGPAPAVIGGKKPMEIARFYSCKAWIGKGVGAVLMQACLHEAEQAACDVVWLDVWEKNPRAIAFYRKWGFEQVGTQAFQLGDDIQNDWLMARSVDRVS
jgi:GNAT superfamily N-acetyltransferase